METRYAKKVEELRGDEDACVRYMLRALPFIKEYTGQAPPAPAPARPAAARKASIFAADDDDAGPDGAGDVLRRYLEAVEQAPARPSAPPPKPLTAPGQRVRRRRGGASADAASLNTCAQCGADDCLDDQRESHFVCVTCGATFPYLDSAPRNFSFNQIQTQIQFASSFAYRPVNHFMEWLNKLQGKENTEIPETVLATMAAEFKQVRATKQSDITPARVRVFLKKYDLGDFYDHSPRICELLGGVPAPRLPDQLVAQLKKMFLDIQEPFRKHKPPDRKNFLSYAFVLYKMTQLLGEDEYLKHFPLLKSNDKLHGQDRVWRKMCEDLEWEFIPSV